MTVYFTSDLHDGHRAIGKYRSTIIPEIVDAKTNREYIGDNWRAKKKNDVIYILGDTFLASDSVQFIKSLCGHKKGYLGNHDLQNNDAPTIAEMLTCCDFIKGIETRKYFGEKFWFSHAPIHPSELRNKKNIHGHIHNVAQDYMNIGSSTYDERYINVNMDVLYPRTGKIMLTLDELDEYRKGFKPKMVFVNISYRDFPSGRVYTDADYYDEKDTALYAADLDGGEVLTFHVQEEAAEMLMRETRAIKVGATPTEINAVFNRWLEEDFTK